MRIYDCPLQIITVCKGRLDHLQIMINNLTSQEDWYRTRVQLIVVDYGCPDGTADYIKSLDSGRIFCVRVNGVGDSLNMAHARNIGFMASTARNLLFMSCDMHFHGSIPNLEMRAGLYDLIAADPVNTSALGTDMYGFICCKRWVVSRLRGFNEDMCKTYPGWGYDSEEFIRRAYILSRQIHMEVDSDYLFHVEVAGHSDAMRTRFYPEKDPIKSYEAHKAYALEHLTKHGLVANVGYPYGIANYEIATNDLGLKDLGKIMSVEGFLGAL